eukprot:TRINITY_DN31737_c0_g1_i1.p1 TRINITY_DN31737_c0_g1~~TRINITY_DN31737_c0_g1_i1.p1  ORF type:complete len:396 (+),score=70.46 TRINITY_DN31737_c0_g1_i1:104-1291(+)
MGQHLDVLVGANPGSVATCPGIVVTIFEPMLIPQVEQDGAHPIVVLRSCSQLGSGSVHEERIETFPATRVMPIVTVGDQRHAEPVPATAVVDARVMVSHGGYSLCESECREFARVVIPVGKLLLSKGSGLDQANASPWNDSNEVPFARFFLLGLDPDGSQSRAALGVTQHFQHSCNMGQCLDKAKMFIVLCDTALTTTSANETTETAELGNRDILLAAATQTDATIRILHQSLLRHSHAEEGADVGETLVSAAGRHHCEALVQDNERLKRCLDEERQRYDHEVAKLKVQYFKIREGAPPGSSGSSSNDSSDGEVTEPSAEQKQAFLVKQDELQKEVSWLQMQLFTQKTEMARAEQQAVLASEEKEEALRMLHEVHEQKQMLLMQAQELAGSPTSP